MKHTSFGRKVFLFINATFLILISLTCILPLINLLALSLSGKSAANSGQVTFWPVDFTVLAYLKTFSNNNFVRSMMISILRTVIATLFSMFVITTAAYALSKDFRGRNVIMWFFVFTMLFGGGHVRAHDQSGAGVYRGNTDSAGISIPAEVFCDRYRDGCGEGVKDRELI